MPSLLTSRAMRPLTIPLVTGAALLAQVGVANAAQSTTSLTASDAAAYSRLGTAVAVSADGSTAVATAPARTSSTTTSVGAVYVYSNIPVGNLLGKKETAILVPPADAETVSGSFGTSVAVSANGSTIAVGAPYWSNVYIFTRNGTTTTWTQTAKVRPGTGPAATSFGRTVALSGDGTRLLVGSPDTSSTLGAGSVRYYTNSGGSWVQQVALAGASSGAHTGS